ncbi:MAG: imidazole glycerol phosphate synthase subunit HisF [Vicinamibacterales bacterium]
MLARRLIACLDVRDGRVVKGVNFRGLRDAGDPASLARRYDAEGIDELVVLDVSATIDGRRAALDTVRAVAAELAIPLTVGGGIRSADDARALMDAGADKVSLNSAALADPSVLTTLARRYGSQAVVIAIDARAEGAGWAVLARSATAEARREAIDWAREAVARGAGEVLLTSIDRDGTRQGFDCALTAAVADAVPVPVIASGGAGTPAHFVDVFTRGGADAALAASVFHDAEHAVRDLKHELAAHGIPVRLDWEG